MLLCGALLPGIASAAKSRSVRGERVCPMHQREARRKREETSRLHLCHAAHASGSIFVLVRQASSPGPGVSHGLPLGFAVRNKGMSARYILPFHVLKSNLQRTEYLLLHRVSARSSHHFSWLYSFPHNTPKEALLYDRNPWPETPNHHTAVHPPRIPHEAHWCSLFCSRMLCHLGLEHPSHCLRQQPPDIGVSSRAGGEPLVSALYSQAPVLRCTLPGCRLTAVLDTAVDVSPRVHVSQRRDALNLLAPGAAKKQSGIF